MNAVYVMVWGAVVFLLSAVANCQESSDRLPRSDEVYEIAEHVRELPPYRSDVTVIVEFAITPVNEKDLRHSVEKVYREMDREQGKVRDVSSIAAEVDREVERLLQEQILPRRIKERWRREGLRYRVDEVRTQTGLESIDASSEWQRSFLYLCDGPDTPRDTAKRDWAQRIMSVFGQRHGNVQASRDVWAGGTVGLGTAVLLKRALGMDLIARDGGSDAAEERVAELVAGTHPEIDIRVVDGDEGMGTREFRIRPKKGSGQIAFVAPADRIEPVSRLEMRNGAGDVTYRMAVHASDENGVATRWTEESIRVPGRGLEQRSFELLDRRMNEPLEDDTFSLSRPEGWTLADHRPERLIVIGPDGKEVPVATPVKEPVESIGPGSSVWWLVLANIIAALTITYVIWAVKARKARGETRRAE